MRSKAFYRDGWARRIGFLLFACNLLANPFFLGGQTRAATPTAAEDIRATVDRFHADRDQRPFWFAADSGKAVQSLLFLLSTSAETDGQGAVMLDVARLLDLSRRAKDGPAQAELAERMLSEALVVYARSLQKDPRVGVVYVDAQLKPQPWSAARILDEARRAPSLETFITSMAWMHPLYGKLREAIVRGRYADARQRHVLGLNLERARALPAVTGRSVLVNTAEQRLQMFSGDKLAGEMKVVVGRGDAQTPMMNAMIRFAILNPYWKVPSDIAARLAPNVIRHGSAYLREKGYRVVSGFGESAKDIDAGTVDWKAVAAGKASVHLLQEPGPTNSMGQVKFMFPNAQGIWLHDTPSRDLFGKSDRSESAGCVRLQDAWKLGSWLMGETLRRRSKQAELRVDLPAPVPLFLVYLTAVPGEDGITFLDDHYRRDLPPQEQVEFDSQGIGKATFTVPGLSTHGRAAKISPER